MDIGDSAGGRWEPGSDWVWGRNRFDLGPFPQRSESLRQDEDAMTAEHHTEKTIPDNVRRFVLKHYADAQKLAASLGNGVTAAEVLAVAGNETGWGKRDTHARFGNFFGIHGHGSAGTYYTKNNHTPVQMFPVSKDSDGFQASGQAFVRLLQDRKVLTPGIGNDPKALFDVLNKAGLYAVDSHPGAYGAFMVRDDLKGWGAYTYVIKCIDQLRQEKLLP
jgi:hypothetical protein